MTNTEKIPAQPRRWLQTILLALVLWLAILSAQILSAARLTTPPPADAAIVLGAAVFRGQPSPVFRERIHYAIRLYQQGHIRALIFTGGVGRNDELSEAEVGRATALAANIPAEALFMETTSRTTLENLQNAGAIAVGQGFERLLIVSDPLHMQRALWMAADLGLMAEPAPTPTSGYRTLRTQIPFFLRELYFNFTYSLTRLLAEPLITGYYSPNTRQIAFPAFPVQ